MWKVSVSKHGDEEKEGSCRVVFEHVDLGMCLDCAISAVESYNEDRPDEVVAHLVEVFSQKPDDLQREFSPNVRETYLAIQKNLLSAAFDLQNFWRVYDPEEKSNDMREFIDRFLKRDKS